MYGFLFLLLFFVPAAALGWRVVVSKTRQLWIRAGAAAAAMTTLVGAFVVFDEIVDFNPRDWRSDLALLAASSGSIYLLAWSQRRRSNRKHRTMSIMAAIIGLVPAFAALFAVFLFRVAAR